MGINVPGSGGGRQLRPPPPPPVRRGSPPTTGAGVIADRPMHGFSGAPQRQQVRQSVINTRRANASVVQRTTSNVGHAVSQSVRQTVGHVFDHQNPTQQAAILRGALRSSSPYAQAVLDHVTTNLRSSFTGGSAWTPKGGWPGGVSAPLKTTDALVNRNLNRVTSQQLTAYEKQKSETPIGLKVLGNVAKSITSGGIYKPGKGKAGGGVGALNNATMFAPGTYGAIPPRALIDTVRATAENPAVIPNTIKGLGETAFGMVAAPVQAITDPSSIGKIPGQLAQHFSQTYGPLLKKNGDRAFINQVKSSPQGAAPQVVDAFSLLGGIDATAGRAIAAAGKAAGAKWATADRPALLLSGGKTRAQTLGNTAGRIAAQRLEDRLRAARTARRPGEIMPKQGQIAPLFQSHAIRVTHSAIAQGWRRTIQENLNKEVRQGALRQIGKLNAWQRKAATHAIEGVRVDTAAHFRADLSARAQAIMRDRTNPKSLGNFIPAQYADRIDELRLIQDLMAHAEKIVGPRMVAFQKGEAARAIRIERATDLNPVTAEARRLRPHGEALGIIHPDEAAALEAKVTGGGLQAALNAARLGDAEASRSQRLAEYVKQVRAGMKEKGLPEPGYLRHRSDPNPKFGDWTSGAGARAMSTDKVSKFVLHRAGVLDRSPDAYVTGLARSIKRPFQWRLTDEQFRAAAHPTPTREMVQAALGRNVHPKNLTGHELRQVLAHQGVDMSKVAFYNPGRLAESTLRDHNLLGARDEKAKLFTDLHEQQVNNEIAHALDQEHVVQKAQGSGGYKPSEAFLTTQGWKAVPKTALDEIQGNLKSSSLAGRTVGKVQGTTAGLILGQNPHFVIMNTLAHAVPAVAGTGGKILPDLVKAPFWWHGLTDEEKNLVRRYEGGRGGHYNMTAKMGSQATNQIAQGWRHLQERGIVQKAAALNPFHAILSAENLQSNFFRHAVMYHELKRQAFQDMAHEYGQGVRLMNEVQGIFTLGPTERMQALIREQPKMEQLGRIAVNLLGDYGRFTNRERQWFNNRAVMFYSFLRHVTRTLLYVLPVRHPLALGLVGELAQLHNNEVRKMLGGVDLPWAYSRVFFNKGGKLSSIDLASTSPISSPLVDIASGGIKEGSRLIAPEAQPILDMIFGQQPSGAPVQRNLFYLANQLGSLSYAYRMAKLFHSGLQTQQGDSIPFIHERPAVKKTAAAQSYQQLKESQKGPLSQQILGQTLGLYPKPDNILAVAQHQAQQAARKGGGGSGGDPWGGWGGTRSSGGSGGGGGGWGGWGG